MQDVGQMGGAQYAFIVDLYAEGARLLTLPTGGRGYWRLLQLRPANGIRLYKKDQMVLAYDAGDAYWARLRSSGYEYEPEVADFLRRLSTFNFRFVDAGANIGFWTGWVQVNIKGTPILSIEPNPLLFRQLRVNNELNGGAARCVQAALTTTSAPSVEFFVPSTPGGHAAASLGRIPNAQSVLVEAIGLDELLLSWNVDREFTVTKLDIEGEEHKLLGHLASQEVPDQILIYEEHGHDLESRATTAALSMPGHAVFFLEPRTSPRRIRTIKELAELKRSRSQGYNCVAIPERLVDLVF